MKPLLILLLPLFASPVFSQLAISEATTKTSLTTSMGTQVVSESQLTTILKDKNLKISVANATTKNDIYIDRITNKVVSLYEIMGKKLGFYVYDTNAAARESILKRVDVLPTDSAKSINGFNCRQVVLRYDSSLKMKDVIVWYNPEQVFTDPTMGLNIPGIEKIKGVPVLVITEAANGMKTTYTLVSIDRKTRIDPEVFIIPKGYTITNPEEFQKAIRQMSQG